MRETEDSGVNDISEGLLKRMLMTGSKHSEGPEGGERLKQKQPMGISFIAILGGGVKANGGTI